SSTFRIELASGSTRILQTDDLGPLTTGAATVRAGLPVGVSALFSIFYQGRLISEGGILDSLELNNFTFPVDSTGGASVGMALFNPNPSAADLILRLLDAQGQLIRSITRTLNAGHQEAEFIEELFGAIPENFKGSLSASSTVP